MIEAHEIEEIVSNCIDKKLPFSLIRLGDGEAMLVRDMRYFPPQARLQILQTWFGKIDFSESEIDNLTDKLVESASNATILGLPSEGKASLMASSVLFFRNFRDGKLYDKPISYLGVAVSMYKNGAIERLVNKAGWCGVIGSKNIMPWIEQRVGEGNHCWYQIPAEQYHSLSPDDTHFPDRFNDIISNIKVPVKGALFLVGAGVCGKVYCERIRSLGGIALDIGSIIDLIAGNNTRNYIEEMLEPIEKLEGLTAEEHVKNALRFESAGDLNLAREQCSLALAIDRSYGQAYYALALINLREKNLIKALTNINSASDYSPFVSKFWNLKGRIEMDLSELDLAEKSLRIARSLRFADGDTLIYLSQICLAQGRLAEAMAFGAEALSYSPEHAFGQIHLSRVLEALRVQ